MKNKLFNVITLLFLIVVIILSVFSYILLNYSKSTIYKRIYTQNDIILSNMINVFENNLKQFIENNKSIKNLNIPNIEHIRESHQLFYKYQNKYIIVLKKGYIIVDKIFFETNIIPITNTPYFNINILNIYEDKDNKNLIRAIAINNNYGFIEDNNHIINYHKISYDNFYSYITISINKLTLTKELNDFAILINTILFFAFFITIIFIALFIKANTQIINIQQKTKRELDYLRFNKLLRMENLSQSIIHNINTPLTTIKGFLNLMEENEPDIAKQYNLNNINKKIDSIIEQLELILNKSKRDITLKEESININNLIKETLLFFSNHINLKGVSLTTNYDKNIPIVKLKVSDLSLIIDNLIDNAIDAMYNSPKKELHVETKFLNNEIIIKIKDSGKGISKKHINRIFDLYYTTKPLYEEDNKPKGTGIGLFSVQQALKRNNWRIKVKTEEGIGSEFILYIPINNNSE